MKLKIEREFIDKYTKEKYQEGSEVNFAEDRATELLNDPRGLVSEVKVENPVEKIVKKATKKPAKKSSK